MLYRRETAFGTGIASAIPTMTSSRPTILVAIGLGSDSLVKALAGHQFRVLVASSGIEVVSHLFPRGDSHGRRPSLMVLAALLPGYNGLSVLAGVRSFGWDTPVLMTWPSRHEWMADEARRLGGCGLFMEPAEPAELASEALRIAGQSQRRTEPALRIVGRPPAQGTAA